MGKSKKYSITEDEPQILAEPAVAVLNEGAKSIGPLGQEHSLNTTDKSGKIVLTSQMQEALAKAENAYKDGKCLSEEAFNQRFEKWL